MTPIEVGRSTSLTLNVPHGTSREDIDAHVGHVMDHLLDLEEMEGSNVHSAAVSFNAGTMEVLIEISGCGATFREAEETADAAVRTAIHAAGGATPEWGEADASVAESEAELRVVSTQSRRAVAACM